MIGIITQAVKRIKELLAGLPALRPACSAVQVKNTPWRGRKSQDGTRSILWTAAGHTRVLQVAL